MSELNIDKSVLMGPVDCLRIQILRNGTWFQYEAVKDDQSGGLLAGMELSREDDHEGIELSPQRLVRPQELSTLMVLAAKAGRYKLRVEDAQ